MKNLNTYHLSLLAMIYNSDEMRGAISLDKGMLKSLEYYHINSINSFKPSQFAMVCNSLRQQDTHFHEFLTKAQEKVV